jgi:hypothetical protein
MDYGILWQNNIPKFTENCFWFTILKSLNPPKEKSKASWKLILLCVNYRVKGYTFTGSILNPTIAT